MRKNAERSALPQAMNVESKVGETVRHNVGGTEDTRARDAQKRCAPRRDDVGRRFTRAWGRGRGPGREVMVPGTGHEMATVPPHPLEPLW